MTKEEKFKNKSIKKKVNDAFNMIFRLYFATVALASLGLILLAVVPDAFRIPVLVICIVIMLTIQVVNLLYCKTNPGIKRCSRASFPWRIT